MRRSRLLVLLPILAFWLAMSGWLLWRERRAPAVDPHLVAGRIEEPIENWMGLFVDDNRVGYVHLQQIPESRDQLDGVTTRITTRVRLELFGRSAALDLTGSAFRPYLEKRADLEFRVRSGDYDFALDGRVADGHLRGQVRSAGETIPLDLAVGEDLMISAGFGSSVAFPPLEVGERVTVPSFDPMSLRATEVEVRCVAREVLTIDGKPIPTRVLQVESGGLETRAWIDDDGAVVRAETPLGIALERISAQQALAPTGDQDFSDFLGLTAIRPTGEAPFRGAERMLFRVSGVPDGELPTDGLQRAEESGLFLRVAESERPDDDVDSPAHLASDAFVQSDHPRVRSTAETILEATPDDPWQRALALHDWVYETIDKEPALSIPSALEVLEQRRGDCNEHAVLYTALARAAGLPTRIAIGVVWSEELDGFYYHAWPEVAIDGRWHWLDPTLGQPTADATHVKILNGGIESWSRLLPWLGKMQIEIEEVS